MNSKLCKYYSLVKYNVQALLNQQLYFSHQLDLNDPFDLDPGRINLDGWSDEMFEKFYFLYFQYVIRGENKSIEKVRKILAQFRKDGGIASNTIAFFWNVLFTKLGILSLTKSDTSLVMWSYYTGHMGFVVNFKDLCFKNTFVYGPFEIQYSSAYKQICPRDVNVDVHEFFEALTSKSKDWKSESEWRYLLKGENLPIPDYDHWGRLDQRLVDYDLSCVESIVLGFKFFKGNIFSGESITESGTVRTYQFSNSETDKMKTQLLNFIVDNNILARQIETGPNGKYELQRPVIEISIEKRDQLYRVVTKSTDDTI